MEPPGRIELPLAAYRAATLRSVGGLVTSRGIEPRSLGLQPSAMTTLARWSDGWSRLEDSNPDSPVIGRMSCLLDEAWVGPAGWSRTSMVPLKRRLAVGPGFEPGSFRVTGGRVTVATTLQTKRGRRNETGCPTWTRATIRGVRGRCPAVRRSGNGRVGRTRTSTHLRPRQVGYRLPYDPKK